MKKKALSQDDLLKSMETTGNGSSERQAVVAALFENIRPKRQGSKNPDNVELRKKLEKLPLGSKKRSDLLRKMMSNIDNVESVTSLDPNFIGRLES